MNIRLDKDVRIRLSEDDVTNWNLHQHLVQTFSLGSIILQVALKTDSAALKSHANTENETLVITLTSDDHTALLSDKGSDKGVSIGDINIQVDRWSKEKRLRHDEKVKDKQA